MFTSIIFIYKAILLSIICNIYSSAKPTVELKQGILEGKEEKSSNGKPILSFLAIPYAKPPIAQLRFEDPVAPEKWKGVLKANKNPEMCPQVSTKDFLTGVFIVTGSEDCLYLNIFTPKPLKQGSEFPVMVFIHGGGYVSGSAGNYGPAYLMNEDIVLVVIQYRLGILGFISTEDEVMPGNLGLKDQQMALTWIQENIQQFGGNPNRVTIFGESAGAGSAHLHMLSPGSKDLFHGVIAQSGVSLCPWSIRNDHRKVAIEFGKKFGCNLDEDFKNCLQQHDAKNLTKMINTLTAFLDRRSRCEIEQIVNVRTNGATPLVMASKNGHITCVEYLVDFCISDLEQVGSVVFDGETIDGAPPLWCAAAAGHLPVVDFLVKRGADVNATTKTNSTPLRAACFDGHFQIVEYLVKNGADIEVANRHGHTCLMIACYKGHYSIANFLIKIEANVNRKSVKGNTALHDCAESGSLNIMKLLLEHGAKMDVDSYGMTPLLAAAVTGHTHIVEYLIACDGLINVQGKIDALELLGATYVDKKRDMLGALRFWKLAMMERYEDGVMIHPKPKQPSLIAAYENAVEVTTMRQLDDIISDPDEMRMQALLVRERILGPAHPDTTYYIRYRGAVYADTGNFSRCITLWMYALEMQQKILEPLSPMTQSSFVSFAELFSFMMNEANNKSSRIPPIDFNDMMKVFEKCLKEIEVGMGQLSRLSSLATKSASTNNTTNSSLKSGISSNSNITNSTTSNSSCTTCTTGERDNTYFHRTLVITLHLICLINKMEVTLTKEQSHALRCAVHRLVKLNPKGSNGVTPLHLACSRETASSVGRFPICSFPNLDVVDLLLEVGADPNARENSGNTPLHTLGANKQFYKDITRSLLNGGAHIDLLNNDKFTFESLRRSKSQQGVILNSLQYTSLQCLCANVLQKHRINYSEILSKKLSAFVSQH